MVIRLALAASLYNELMTIIFLFNEWGQLLATLKYSDVMLIFFIFIVNFNMNLINRIDYKYKRNKHCVTILKKKKKIINIRFICLWFQEFLTIPGMLYFSPLDESLSIYVA